MALTPVQNNSVKDIVKIFLTGARIKTMRNELNDIQSEVSVIKLFKEFDLRDDPYFCNSIFIGLGIHTPAEQAPYLDELARDSSLYSFLKHLRRGGHYQIHTLLKLIDETKSPTNWTAIFSLGALFSAVIGLVYIYKQEKVIELFEWINARFPRAYNLISNTFTIRNIPLAGLIFSAFMLAIDWYQTFSNEAILPKNRLTKLLFRSLSSFLKMTAYLLSFLAIGEMGLLTATLFFLSSSIDVVQSLRNLWNAKEFLPDHLDGNWAERTNIIRENNFLSRRQKTDGIKIGTAVLICIIGGIWAFFPPSIILSASCLTCMFLVDLIKRSELCKIYDHYEVALQDEIKKIPNPPFELVESQYTDQLDSRAKAVGEAEQTVQQNTRYVDMMIPFLKLRKNALEEKYNQKETKLKVIHKLQENVLLHKTEKLELKEAQLQIDHENYIAGLVQGVNASGRSFADGMHSVLYSISNHHRPNFSQTQLYSEMMENGTQTETHEIAGILTSSESDTTHNCI